MTDPSAAEELSAIIRQLDACRDQLTGLLASLGAEQQVKPAPPITVPHRKRLPGVNRGDGLCAVQAAIVQARRRSNTDHVRAIVMRFGGVTSEGVPSLRALPPENYAAVIEALTAG